LKTLALISHKGGVGKSTLAIHLAVQAHQQGLETLLVDLDSISSTASEWAGIREAQQPVVVTAELSDVRKLQQQAIDEKFDLLILDCPPYLTDEVLEISKLADHTLLPVIPNFPELQSLHKYIGLIEQHYSVILNSCIRNENDQESLKTAQLAEMLKDHEIPASPVHIARLEAFTESLSSGVAVCEYRPESDATEQVKELLGDIL
jgi:chromosome partitioning protein